MKKIEPMFVYDEKGKKTGAMFRPSDFEIIIEELEDYKEYERIKKEKGIRWVQISGGKKCLKRKTKR